VWKVDVKMERRIKRLETKVNKMYDMIAEMKRGFDDFIALTSQKKLMLTHTRARTTTVPSKVISTPMSGTYDKGANPWAFESAKSLFSAQIGRLIIDRAYETYKPTIEALRSAPNGLTAGEISKITGRARNTEATYLQKLYRAGFTERELKGGKAIYKLADEAGLPEVFGER